MNRKDNLLKYSKRIENLPVANREFEFVFRIETNSELGNTAGNYGLNYVSSVPWFVFPINLPSSLWVLQNICVDRTLFAWVWGAFISQPKGKFVVSHVSTIFFCQVNKIFITKKVGSTSELQQTKTTTYTTLPNH